MLHELLTLYERNAKSTKSMSLPAVTPYREYLAWLAAWDRKRAEAAWQKELAGLKEPTHLAPQRPPGSLAAPAQLVSNLPEKTTIAMQECARQHNVTFNTIIQAAWTVLLSRYTGKEDLVFGSTMAGRPGEIPGIERMVGLFINTLPVRMQLRAAGGRPEGVV
jgi:hypothetical protein